MEADENMHHLLEVELKNAEEEIRKLKKAAHNSNMKIRDRESKLKDHTILLNQWVAELTNAWIEFDVRGEPMTFNKEVLLERCPELLNSFRMHEYNMSTAIFLDCDAEALKMILLGEGHRIGLEDVAPELLYQTQMELRMISSSYPLFRDTYTVVPSPSEVISWESMTQMEDGKLAAVGTVVGDDSKKVSRVYIYDPIANFAVVRRYRDVVYFDDDEDYYIVRYLLYADNHLFGLDSQDRMIVWDTSFGCKYTFSTNFQPVRSMTVLNNGMLCIGQAFSVSIFDPASLEERRVRAIGDDGLEVRIIGPCIQRLRGSILCVDREKRDLYEIEAEYITNPQSLVSAVRLNLEDGIAVFIESRSGDTIFIGDYSGHVHVIRLNSIVSFTQHRLLPKHCSVCQGNDGLVKELLELRDGRLCSSGLDATIRIWDVNLLMCMQVLEINMHPSYFPYGSSVKSGVFELWNGSICFLGSEGAKHTDDIEDETVIIKVVPLSLCSPAAAVAVAGM